MPNKLKGILEELARHTYSDKYISKALSQIETWIEGKRVQGIKFHSGRQNSELSAYSPTDNQKVGRNQLITELIGELK